MNQPYHDNILKPESTSMHAIVPNDEPVSVCAMPRVLSVRLLQCARAANDHREEASALRKEKGTGTFIIAICQDLAYVNDMPRIARASVGGVCYHVMNRGNGRRQVFHKEGDYHAFLKVLYHACVEIPMPVLGYCLMMNHS